jgi:hypothetical protein
LISLQRCISVKNDTPPYFLALFLVAVFFFIVFLAFFAAGFLVVVFFAAAFFAAVFFSTCFSSSLIALVDRLSIFFVSFLSSLVTTLRS